MCEASTHSATNTLETLGVFSRTANAVVSYASGQCGTVRVSDTQGDASSDCTSATPLLCTASAVIPCSNDPSPLTSVQQWTHLMLRLWRALHAIIGISGGGLPGHFCPEGWHTQIASEGRRHGSATSGTVSKLHTLLPVQPSCLISLPHSHRTVCRLRLVCRLDRTIVYLHCFFTVSVACISLHLS
jgi:hypothetical protein